MDGPIEKVYRTLKQTLQCILSNRWLVESEWADALGVIDLSINANVASVTGEVPLKLDFAAVPRMPADMVVDR